MSLVSSIHLLLIEVLNRETWFNQPDIDQIKGAGLNTVRLPVGTRLSLPLLLFNIFIHPHS